MLSIDPATRIFHFACPIAWRTAAESGDAYAPASLASDGFICAVTEAQIEELIERRLRGNGPYVRLTLDPQRFGNGLIWEWSEARAEVYPHLTVAIPLDAVLETLDFDPDA